MITVIFFIFLYILIIMTLGFLIYSYIEYIKIVKEIDKAIEEADKVLGDEYCEDFEFEGVYDDC